MEANTNQTDLIGGPFCLQNRLPKNIIRRKNSHDWRESG